MIPIRDILPHPDSNLALVQLTKGFFAIIDACYADPIGKFNWFENSCTSKYKHYASTNHDPILGREDVSTSLHRYVAFLHGMDISGLVDHRDGNGLDCRFSNLRPATKATNAWNRGIDSNNTSGVKGVHFEAFTGRWRAEIWVNKKHLRLGRFASKEQAATVIARARREFHGEFANSGSDLAAVAG